MSTLETIARILTTGGLFALLAGCAWLTCAGFRAARRWIADAGRLDPAESPGVRAPLEECDVRGCPGHPTEDGALFHWYSRHVERDLSAWARAMRALERIGAYEEAHGDRPDRAIKREAR